MQISALLRDMPASTRLRPKALQISAPPGPHQAMEQLEEEREQTMVGGSTGLTRAVLA